MKQKGFAPIVFLVIAGALIIGGGIAYKYTPLRFYINPPTNFEECKKATGGRIIETKPPKCEFLGELFVDNSPESQPGYLKDTITAQSDTGESATETADWQTYRNEKYGFEFKYPKEYFIKDGENGVEIVNKEDNTKNIAYHEDCIKNFDGGCPPFNMMNSIDVRVLKEVPSGWLMSDSSREVKPCVVGGIKGHCIFEGTHAGADALFSISMGSGAIVFGDNIGWPWGSGDQTEGDAVKNRIISTYKFIVRQKPF